MTSTEAVTTTIPATTTGETLAPETAEEENKLNLGVILPIALVSTAVIVSAIIVISKKRGKKS
ncbi:MAG: hypothetical protein LBM87_01160 [Ruminococcus sp.]|nr:hypothetical protein [Ruminococcus sp.]